MATFTGTAGNNTIIPGTVSAGVIVVPAGATPGGENDTISGLAGADQLDGGGGNDNIDGGTENDTLRGASGDDSLTGGDGNDSLTGGIGGDSLTGGIGDDDYVFGATDGADFVTENLAGGLDEIRLAAPIRATQLDLEISGSDLIITRGALSITLVNQFISGGGANARVERIVFSNNSTLDLTNALAAWRNRTGDEEANNLTGSGFADTIAGRGGDDFITGGNDNDELSGDGGNDQINGDAGEDELNGGAGNDNLSGGLGDDTLLGGTGNDNLSGGDNNDILTGGVGDDNLSGGIGNDNFLYSGAFGNDTVSEALSGGTDDIEFTDGTTAAQVSYFLEGSNLVLTTPGGTITVQSQFASGTGTSARVERVVFNDGTIVLIRNLDPAWLTRTGTEVADSFTGSGFDDILLLLEGGDFGSGGEGDDSIDGGAGNDNLQGGNGDDTLLGGAGGDFLAGGNNDDTYRFDGFQGVDTISETLGFGNDRIVFEPGTNLADVTLRVIGSDLILSGAGGQFTISAQFTSGTGANARVEELELGNGQLVDLTVNQAAWRQQTGTASNDAINGSIFDDTLNGGDGNDQINAGIGNDSLLGGDGNDNLTGGTGADTFDGGVGNDFFSDGGDSDDYIFRPGDGSDSISGFQDGLDSLVFGNYGAAFNTDAEIIAAAQQVGASLVITLPNPNGVGSTVVTLFNFQLANLDGGQIDFL